MARKKRRGRPAGQPNKPRRRKSFVFMGYWFDTIEALPTDCQLEIYQTIIRYALTGVEPSRISITTRTVLLMAKKDIDPYLNCWEVHSSSGMMGGNPNFVKGQPNPYREKIDKTLAEQKKIDESQIYHEEE